MNKKISSNEAQLSEISKPIHKSISNTTFSISDIQKKLKSISLEYIVVQRVRNYMFDSYIEALELI